MILAVLLTACGDDDTPAPQPKPVEEKAERTILVYMAAENNLTRYATDDLNEMKSGSLELNDRQKLIVYVDQADINRPPYLARVKDGELCDTIYYQETSTADPATLEEVLRQTITDNPANSYGLILWGHASGMLISPDSIPYSRSRAYGGDTDNNSTGSPGNTWMNIPPMGRALRNALGSERLAFIMADCCSFVSVETAYELRQVCDYLVGSPAEIPDAGAPYQKIVPALFSNSNDYLHQAIDAYYDYYIDEYRAHPTTYRNLTSGDLNGFSVPLISVKTAKMEPLAAATATLLSTIAEKLTPPDTIEHEVIDYSGLTYYAMNKSYRFAYDIKQLMKHNTDPADFAIWEETFNQAVDYSRHSTKWFTAFNLLAQDMLKFETDGEDFGVLSIFVPKTDYISTHPNWNTAIQQYQWNDIVLWQQYGW